MIKSGVARHRSGHGHARTFCEPCPDLRNQDLPRQRQARRLPTGPRVPPIDPIPARVTRFGEAVRRKPRLNVLEGTTIVSPRVCWAVAHLVHTIACSLAPLSPHRNFSLVSPSPSFVPFFSTSIRPNREPSGKGRHPARAHTHTNFPATRPPLSLPRLLVFPASFSCFPTSPQHFRAPQIHGIGSRASQI